MTHKKAVIAQTVIFIISALFFPFVIYRKPEQTLRSIWCFLLVIYFTFDYVIEFFNNYIRNK